jgi:hypothetical protein
LLATTTYGQDEDFGWDIENSGIEYCKWVSIIARDIMTARQQGKPMSETLPFALDRIRDFPEDMGLDVEELSEDMDEEKKAEMLAVLENFYQGIKPIITELVMRVYEAPAYTFEENQRTAISELENATFAQCYEGYEEEAALEE